MSAPALKIREEMFRRIHAHGVETYPHECCGAILGRDGEGSREVIDLLPLANRRDDSPRNRFEVTADDVRLAEKTAREKKLELIGWYHSHPDAPARPSEYDRDHAWPWYSYIIVSVQKGEPRDTTSWRLHDDRAACVDTEQHLYGAQTEACVSQRYPLRRGRPGLVALAVLGQHSSKSAQNARTRWREFNGTLEGCNSFFDFAALFLNEAQRPVCSGEMGVLLDRVVALFKGKIQVALVVIDQGDIA